MGRPGSEVTVGHHPRFDLDLNDADFYEALREKVRLDKSAGLQYMNFHIRLPLRYLHTGGEYREDRAYHRLA